MYRPARIRVSGRKHSYTAYLIYEDDGTLEPEADPCPVHGHDGVPRDERGRGPEVWPEGCHCPVYVGIPIQEGPFHGRTHRRAWRKAWKEAEKQGGLTAPSAMIDP